MSAWILIILLAGGSSSAGGGATSVRFQTRTGCEAAKAKIERAYQTGVGGFVALLCECVEDPAAKK